MENYMEIKMPNKKHDIYVVELTQQGSYMECSIEEEFYRLGMVLSLSLSRRNYISSHIGMFIIQGGMERGGKINQD
jgi:hypothetical protein